MWLLILGVACYCSIVHIYLQGDIVHQIREGLSSLSSRTTSNDVYSEVIVSVAV